MRKPQGREWSGVLGKGNSKRRHHQLSLGKCCKLPQWIPGRSPEKMWFECILIISTFHSWSKHVSPSPLSALDTALSVCMYWIWKSQPSCGKIVFHNPWGQGRIATGVYRYIYTCIYPQNQSIPYQFLHGYWLFFSLWPMTNSCWFWNWND